MVEVKKRSETNVTPIERGAEQSGTGSSKGLHPIDEMNKMFNQFFHRNLMKPANWEWPDLGHIPMPFGGKMPRMDVIDREKEILIRAEIPGVDKDDLEITMTGNTVMIKGKSKFEEKEEKGNYFRSEISHGVFQRSMVLPTEVDVDKAMAVFKDGLMELTAPKLAKASRSIPIK